MPTPRSTVPEPSTVHAAGGPVGGMGTPAVAAILDACSSAKPPAPAPSVEIAAPRQARHVGHPVGQPADRDGVGAPRKDGAFFICTAITNTYRPAAVESFERKFGVGSNLDVQQTPTKYDQDPGPSSPTMTSARRAMTRWARWSLRAASSTFQPQLYPEHQKFVAGFQQPLGLDREWRYSVPYTVYTTGLGWRADQIAADIGALANPCEALWDPAYKRETAVIDDWHTAMAMVLLSLGIDDAEHIVSGELTKLADALNDMKQKTSPPSPRPPTAT